MDTNAFYNSYSAPTSPTTSAAPGTITLTGVRSTGPRLTAANDERMNVVRRVQTGRTIDGVKSPYLVKLQNQTAAVEDATKALESAQSRVKYLEEELKVATAELHLVTLRGEERRDEALTAGAHLDSKNKQIIDLESQLNHNRVAIGHYEELLQDLLKETEDSYALIQTLRDELEGLRALAVKDKEAYAQTQQLEIGAQSLIDSFTSELERVNTLKLELQNEIADLRAEVEALRESLIRVTSDNVNLGLIIADLRAQLRSINLEIADSSLSNSETITLRQEIQSLRDKVAELETLNQALKTNNEQLAEIGINGLTHKEDSAQTVKELTSQISDLEMRIGELTATISTLQEDKAVKVTSQGVVAAVEELKTTQVAPEVTTESALDRARTIALTTFYNFRKLTRQFDTSELVAPKPLATVTPINKSGAPVADTADKNDKAAKMDALIGNFYPGAASNEEDFKKAA